MTATQIDIQLIAIVTAAACALPGVFLVLQRKAMMSDAISHTVLLGIVAGFFLVGDLKSPVLIVGAAAVGVLTVSLVAAIERTRLVKSDAAIGLVFPALFSIAVILISVYAGDVHLDTDAVLVGEIALAPFDRMVIGGVDIGPRGLYLVGGVLLINLIFILLFYKELKLATFDAGLALTLGFMPGVLHYALMGLVSVTVVSAFDIVGSVLVVALMIAPPAAAYLLTDHLARMIGLSVLAGIVSAVGGYWAAYVLDASIAGSMAGTAGLVFGSAFLFAPERGLVSQLRRQKRQKLDFAVNMLTTHLFNHENSPEASEENRFEHLQRHMRWETDYARIVVERAKRYGLLNEEKGLLKLTADGRKRAVEVSILS